MIRRVWQNDAVQGIFAIVVWGSVLAAAILLGGGDALPDNCEGGDRSGYGMCYEEAPEPRPYD